MIPTLIVFGLVFGRWWRTSLAIAAVAWPLLLFSTDTIGLERTLFGAAGLAVVNTSVGVVIHQAVLLAVRTDRERRGLRRDR